MKKLLILFFVLSFFLSVQAISLDRHEIEIFIKEDGFAIFKEKYIIGFENGEKTDFLENLEKNGKDFLLWKQDYDFVFPRFSSIEKIKKINNISFNNELNVLEIEYERENAFAFKDSETARSTLFKISDNEFVSFLTGNSINIPANTIISIFFPEKSSLNTIVESEKILTEPGKIVISDFKGSNISLSYLIEKPIVGSINTQQLLTDLLVNPFVQYFLIAFVLVLVVLIIKRDLWVSKIENFVIENSEVKYPVKESEETSPIENE